MLLGWVAVSLGLQAGEAPSPPVQTSVPIKLTGFGQVLYSRAGESADSFTVSRARLSLDSPITRAIRLRATVDAVKSPVLIEAALDLSIFKNGSLRLGQFKVPFSRESLTAASDHETINLPRSVSSLSPGRDIGASGRDIGALLQYKAGVLEASAGLFNGSGINRADTNRQKDLAGRLVIALADRLKLGASVYRGLYSAAAGQALLRRDRVGLELEAAVSRLGVKAEWILAWDGNVSKRGGYAQVGASLAGGKVQAVARFDSLDRISPSTPGRDETWTLGLNRFFAPKTKIQVNLEWKHERESGRATEFYLLALFQAGF
ncbi:MAG: hypothetical protein A2Y86_04310 [Candidatus Aminicenantes bacterium RBG_13_62_12]|nr:MAG: hypothetical protein A2Y86_04310 [Candidatus Aminicenantes bacterium RBG_13_62_12]